MTRFFGFETIYGVDGEHATPFLTRIRTGRLRIHIFHRGDADPDPHDHPWDFWTFPLTSYVEEVVDRGSMNVFRQVVPAWRWSYRPAEHTHRVLGRYDSLATMEVVIGAFVFGARRVPPQCQPGKIITIVWQGKSNRKWGFLRNRDGNWCWTPWREYVFGGGKHAPCEPSDGGA
ncbi:MAG: hypothetical protein E5X86_26655 [Mesorhizobium sp.]|uniref:hypothetical protein n=1 Tax=Mesorhizobium sp. TaxID=1871066 RepID=UPI000FE8269E|nr:hypothetical protein [Mesorhizobium sp.]RWI98494.1 MAG: hypothetical protein EOR23_33900 [Mesorhizobium sp.]RWK94514.1 MAG: hypothetical protein EOR53_18055 [Mesorhizobium sp.]TIO14033.1 MAG: hypothetical protein E5X86_26655 [Mesorhizobium sp.]TIQ18920.1 MAG: hypothetical protein E5X51_23655 [Mesorhizobium sp.]TJV33920.1 MAG: hypothetical protein E5X87_11470 [Mesorhizobium sp.]